MAFSIISECTQTNKKFQLRRHTIEFKLNKIKQPLGDPEQWIKDGLKVIYNRIIEALTSDDRVGLTLSSDLLQHDVHLPMTDANNLNFDQLWDMMHNLYQSNTEATEGDTLKLIMTSFPNSKHSVTNQGKGLANLSEKNDASLEILQEHQQQPSTQSSSNTVLKNSTVGHSSALQHEENTECRVCRCQLTKGGGLGLCDRCYIKAGQCKQRFIPYSVHSWSNYEDFKKWQLAYDRKKIRCDICDMEMSRTSIYRHMVRKHPDANMTQ